MRVATRTRRGSVSLGLGELLIVAFFVGPFYLLGYTLAAVVKLAAWTVQQVIDARRRNPVAPPHRHP